MSLIYFHIFLMSAGILFSFAFTLWEQVHYGNSHKLFDLAGAIISAIFTAGLIVYLIWFIKKKKPHMKS